MSGRFVSMEVPYMNTKALAMAAVVALVASPALAVDLVNEDAVTYEVLLDDGSEPRLISIAAGETLTKVCDECVLSVGDSSLDAEEIEVAVIKNGALGAK